MPAVKIFYLDAFRSLNRVFLIALRAVIIIIAWLFSLFIALISFIRRDPSIIIFAESISRVKAPVTSTLTRSPLLSPSSLVLLPPPLLGPRLGSGYPVTPLLVSYTRFSNASPPSTCTSKPFSAIIKAYPY